MKYAFIVISAFLTLFSCVSKNTPPTSTNEYFIVSAQDEYKQARIDSNVKFYCLLYTKEKRMKEILNNLYASRYSFYDTICNTEQAKCILNYWGKYWTSSCSIGKLNLTHFSLEDSVTNSSIIQKLQNRANYSYKNLNIGSNDFLHVGLYIGVAKVKSLEYCKIFDRGFCDLPSDTVIILKPGFDMTKLLP
jgi:hypothetical protein